jgi:hypothetical protein
MGGEGEKAAVMEKGRREETGVGEGVGENKGKRRRREAR